MNLLYKKGLCIWVVVIMIFMMMLLFLSLLFRKELKKREKKCKTKKRKDDYRKRIRKNTIFNVILMVIFACFFGVACYNSKYMIADAFAWSADSNSEDLSALFQVQERADQGEKSESYQALHMEWMDEAFEDEEKNIDQKILDQYKSNVKDIFSNLPMKKDRVRIPENLPVKWEAEMKQKHDEFKETVSKAAEELTSAELWKGYNAGMEIIGVYDKSENVFQIAVLAEGAHNNAVVGEDTIPYAAGAIRNFEEFLSFEKRCTGKQNGKEIYIEEPEVAFREGKILLRESEKKVHEGTRQEKHFSLFGWNCFRYALDRISYENPAYLLYLYYSTLSGIKIFKFINDEELKEEIAGELWDKWEEIEKQNPDYLKAYDVEDKNDAQILQVKKMLLNYLNAE